jgi:hypothetical protein
VQYWTAPDTRGTYTDGVKSRLTKRAPARRAPAAAEPSHDGDAGLERIKRLEEALALARTKNRWQPELTRAIRIEANAYRKTLDREQAAATRDSRPEFGLDPVSQTARQTIDHKTAAGPDKAALDGHSGRSSPSRARRR